MTENPITILVVDDEPAHIEAIRRALDEAGAMFQVLGATSLAEFRQITATTIPDLIIADLNLPDGSAIEILEAPPLPRPWPVLVMTAFGDEEIAVKAIKSGALDYIVKTESVFGDMPRLIERALREWSNIRQRRQAEEEREKTLLALQKSQALLEAVFESTSDCIAVLDEQCRYLLANQATSILTGIPRDRLIGMDIREISWPFPETLNLWVERLANVFITRQPLKISDITPTPQGQVFSESLVSPVFDAQGRVFAVSLVYRDVTERRKAEEDRRELEHRMLHVQKLESLGVLAGGMAHDFNNILMAVLGHADLALQELPPMSPARENLSAIEKASRRAAELCRQMLAYSGKGKFVIQDIALGDLVSEMVHLLKASISKKALLNLHLEKSLPPMEGDATQIRQVLMNLITNASEAIGERSGVITITTGAMECTRDYLAQTSVTDDLPEGLYVFLEVSDTGCGMTRETLNRIFEPFFTTKFTGRGLGMAAVLGIVRGHKGTIRIYSELNKGTTFRLLFPALTSAITQPGHTGPHPEPPWHGSGLLLLVDDEESIRALGKTMLEKIGFSVLTAADGREAIRLFEREKERLSYVLLDLTMPHMDGEETFREMRRLGPEIRVVLSSGYTEQEITARFAGKGLAGFIQKPYTMGALRATFRDLAISPGRPGEEKKR